MDPKCTFIPPICNRNHLNRSVQMVHYKNVNQSSSQGFTETLRSMKQKSTVSVQSGNLKVDDHWSASATSPPIVIIPH